MKARDRLIELDRCAACGIKRQPVSDNGNQTAPNSSGAGDIPAGDNNREINTSQGNANEEIAPSTGQEGTNSGTQPSGNGGVEGGQEGV